jgi:2',3'-cyclic-nucleotide 2'-phosphodiesterase (5'-nucleotidase family)
VPRLVILHSNDLHGRIDALARIATIVEQVRAQETAPVLYVDAGDVEEATVRISNLTKGAAMHRLLSAAGCQAAVVGNAAWLRYGFQVIPAHAEAASYPLLLANLPGAQGVRPAVMLVAGGWNVGLIGITDPFPCLLGAADYGVQSVDVIPLVRTLATELRDGGADLVVLLSHVGYENPALGYDDRDLAAALDGVVDLVIGAHSHTLLPTGKWIGGVLVTQAGEFGEQLGRIDVRDGNLSARVLPVPSETPRHPGVLAAAEQAERALGAHLDEVIAHLDLPLDAGYVAGVYRRRMQADVGIATEFATLNAPLPPGPLDRRTLWEQCDSTGNPGVVEMAGRQLEAMIQRAADPEFQSSTARPLRGKPRGRLFVCGSEAIDPDRVYRVAGSDWELEPYGGMVEDEWALEPIYDFPTIVREAIEDDLSP